MKSRLSPISALLISFFIFFAACSDLPSKDIIRPEEIKSMRLVVYDKPTYAKLAEQWKEYYEAFPSEYAYAHWMRAADYADDSSYWKLLDKGLKKYPANPTLLYLKSLERAGSHDNTEARGYLERAASLDPGFIDPWFALIPNYMDVRDEERFNLALRRILESGVIADEVFDFNFNMISALEPNAILITNGDNDTFPGWILSRILKFRPDVTVVNRSLLNTGWYPLYVIEQGLPRFVEEKQIDSIRNYILEAVKAGKRKPSSGIFSDTLLYRITESAKTAGRPVYLSKTLFMTDEIRPLFEKGRDLGMTVLVSPSEKPYARQLQETFETWLQSFRTAGLESWRLRNSPRFDAGRYLVQGYGLHIATNLASLKTHAPQLVEPLFKWYIKYVEPVESEENRGRIAQAWCGMKDIEEISEWCRKQGINK